MGARLKSRPFSFWISLEKRSGHDDTDYFEGHGRRRTLARWPTAEGRGRQPYVNHLLEVAALVAEADEGNTDLIVAALLHDAIEDQRSRWRPYPHSSASGSPVLSRRRPTTSRFQSRSVSDFRSRRLRRSRAMRSC